MCFMLDYQYTRPLTKIKASDQRVQRNNSPTIHSDVNWCSFRCIPGELFFWTLWSTFRCTLCMGNKPGIHGVCFPVDSFDLRCESVTYGFSTTV